MHGKSRVPEALDAPSCAAEIARIRENNLLGKSGRLSDLFDYLLERSLKNEPPKEIEIIEAVFSGGGRITPEDSVARVYVHRLRKRLEEIAAKGGAEAKVRFQIPRGEYRLIAEQLSTDASDKRAPVNVLFSRVVSGVRSHGVAAGIAAGLGLLVIGNVAAWPRLVVGGQSNAGGELANADLWAPLVDSDAPLLVVVGDYYMFGEYEDRLFLTRLIRDFSINSKDDLVEQYLTSPEAFDKYGDVALQYLPTSAAFALADLSPVLSGKEVQVTLASELTDTQLKANDIIYVGLISGLGKLKEPVFAGSRFAIGESYDIIHDARQGRTYTSEAFLAAPSDSMYRDYGLFKAFSGPTGRHIMVLAGARDTALMGLSETLMATTGDARLNAGGGGVEALFEVQGRKHVNLEARLLAEGAVDNDAIWSSAPGDMPVFPSR